MQDPVRFKEFSAICDELDTYLGSKIEWSKEEALELYGKVF